LIDRDFIDRRVDAAVASAAKRATIPAETFEQSDKDPASFVAVGDVVIKIRLPFLHSRRAATLYDEWTTLRQLASHPGIVKPIEYRADADWEMLILPKLEGMSLGEWNKKHRDESSARQMLLRIVDILAYLTNSGIVHRDLLPHNLIVSDDGRLTLIDFDEAVAISPADISDGFIPQTTSQLLLPWADLEDLVISLGWKRHWDELRDRLDDWWDASLPGEWYDEIPDEMTAALRDVWLRWHAVVSSCDLLRGLPVDVEGPMADLVIELLSVWGISDPAAMTARKAVIAIGPGQLTDLIRVVADYDLAIIELSQPINQARELRDLGLEVVALPGPFPIVAARRVS
jgi:serine/threonine protein kinase